MASGVVEAKALSGAVSGKTAPGSAHATGADGETEGGSTAAAATAEKVVTGSAAEGMAVAAGASPACSGAQHPVCSGAQTSLGSRSLEGDASSCSVEVHR